MNTPPKFSINSTSAPDRDLTIFSFLEKRYKPGFFLQFVNRYFLLLLEDSNRFQWKDADHFDKQLTMVFNPKLVDAKCFSRFFLHGFIYNGPNSVHESGEITMLDSPDRFLLSSKYTRMKQLKFDEKRMKNELLRQAGLLLIHNGMGSYKGTEPRFITTTRHGVSFCDTRIIKDSLLKYKGACSSTLERINSVAPFGRTYASIFNEYFGFLDFTIKKFHNLLTDDLKGILSKWHQHYKQGTIAPDQNTGEGMPSATGPLHYLQGRPPGSAKKK